MDNQDVQTKSAMPSLKDLLARLREINGILDTSEQKLDYLATNSPQDANIKDAESPVSELATLDDLNVIIDRIARRANHIAKSTNTIVGS